MTPTILLVTADLMTSSRVAGAAQRVGATLRTVATVAGAVGEERDETVDLVLFDLASPIGDLTPAITRFHEQAHPAAKIVAFGPHVHEAKLEAARRAGCDQVLTRGQFHATIDELLASGCR